LEGKGRSQKSEFRIKNGKKGRMKTKRKTGVRGQQKKRKRKAEVGMAIFGLDPSVFSVKIEPDGSQMPKARGQR
jgi:hypothetical protein